jgi:hypothetical protein
MRDRSCYRLDVELAVDGRGQRTARVAQAANTFFGQNLSVQIRT